MGEGAEAQAEVGRRRQEAAEVGLCPNPAEACVWRIADFRHKSAIRHTQVAIRDHPWTTHRVGSPFGREATPTPKIAVTICAWVPSTAELFQNLNEVDRKASAVLHFSEKEFR
jgi:hypothetical protein